MIHRTAFEPRSPLTSSIFNSLHTAGFIKTRLTPKTALQVFLCRYFKLSRRKNKSPSSKMVCSDFRLMIPISILEFKQQFCSAFPSFSIRSSAVEHRAVKITARHGRATRGQGGHITQSPTRFINSGPTGVIPVHPETGTAKQLGINS